MTRPIDETSDALVAAAHGLLTAAGPEALTVRRIANAAGMSTMNVYSRFGGKDGVIDEIYADGYRRLLATVDAIPTTDDVPSDLLQIAATYRNWATANPQYYAVMFRSAVPGFAPSAGVLEIARSGLARLVARVRLGLERGDIAADGWSDPSQIAMWLWATCHGMISLELDGVSNENTDWDELYANGTRAAVRGLWPFPVTTGAVQ